MDSKMHNLYRSMRNGKDLQVALMVFKALNDLAPLFILYVC